MDHWSISASQASPASPDKSPMIAKELTARDAYAPLLKSFEQWVELANGLH
jgi:hypothetical protein